MAEEPREPWDRTQLIAVLAAFLLLGVSLGFWIFPRLGGSGPAEAGAPDRLFPKHASRSSAPVSIGLDDLMSLLAGHPENPAAKRFTDAVMADPKLRGLWEKLARTPRGPARASLLAQLRGSSTFTELLNQLKRDPEARAFVQREIAKIRANPDAGAIGSRMLAKGDEIFAEERPLPPGSPERKGAPPTSAPPSRRFRGGGGGGPPSMRLASVLLGRLSQSERATLMQSVQSGYPVVKACQEAGLAERCVQVHDSCAQEAECGAKLAEATGYSRDAVFAIRGGQPPAKPPPPKAAPPPPPPPPPPPAAGPGPGTPSPPPADPGDPPPATSGDPPPPPPDPSPPPVTPPPPPPPSGPPPPPGTPPPPEPPPPEPPPPEPPPEPPPPECMPYGSLCGIQSDCNSDWNYDDCGTCCNQPPKYNWNTCTYEDPYGDMYGYPQYGSHTWSTCQ